MLLMLFFFQPGNTISQKFNPSVTDGPTDGRADAASFRDLYSHLKTGVGRWKSRDETSLNDKRVHEGGRKKRKDVSR